MDEKERVRLILERVMGYFVLNETATGWRTPDFARGLSAPAGFHWPIAFWNTDGECWMTRDIATDPIFFNPLHDMNDAWQVLKQAMQQETTDQETLTYKLLEATWGDLSPFEVLALLCTWTAEKICDAVLEAIDARTGEK